jgi:hypothetical protein
LTRRFSQKNIGYKLKHEIKVFKTWVFIFFGFLLEPTMCFRTQLFFIKLCQILATENFEIIFILAHQNFNIAIKMTGSLT